MIEGGACINGVTVLASGEYASVGDDGALTISGGAETRQVIQQVIQHPHGLLSVLALPNGDIATGGKDGCVRVFSRSPDRYAATTVRKQFEDTSRLRCAGGVGGQGEERRPSMLGRVQKVGFVDGERMVEGGTHLPLSASRDDAEIKRGLAAAGQALFRKRASDGVQAMLDAMTTLKGGRVAGAIKARTISVGNSQENKTRSKVSVELPRRNSPWSCRGDVDEGIHEEVRRKDEWNGSGERVIECIVQCSGAVSNRRGENVIYTTPAGHPVYSP